MSSGVKVSAEVEEAFKNMQQKKNCPYLIFKIGANNTVIEIDKVGQEGETFEDFKTHMVNVAQNDKDARYAVFDVYDDADTGKNKTGKLVFILWSHDSIKIKQKMLYTSSVQELKKKLAGYHKEIECHSDEDLTLQALREKLGK